MKIGVPKEIKPQENRIGLTPDSVKQLTSNGHKVLVEKQMVVLKLVLKMNTTLVLVQKLSIKQKIFLMMLK